MRITIPISKRMLTLGLTILKTSIQMMMELSCLTVKTASHPLVDLTRVVREALRLLIIAITAIVQTVEVLLQEA